MAQSCAYTRSVRKHNLEYMPRAHRRLESWNFELSTHFGSVNYQIHQTAVVMLHQPTHVTRTTSIMDPSLTEPTNVTVAPNRFINNGSWSQTDQSWQGHWQYFGWENSQDLWDPLEYHTCGYLNTKDHSQETRWTQLTLLVNNMNPVQHE